MKETYESVKKFIEEKGDVLLSEAYSNNRQKLEIKCGSCNSLFSVDFYKYKESRGCKTCVYIRFGNERRKPMIEVKKFFEDHGFTLLEESYKNAKIPMKTLCNICGYVWNINYTNVDCGKGCPNCAKNNYRSGIRPTKEYNFELYFPDIAKEWDYEKNEKIPSQITPHSGMKYWWICQKCHNSYLSSANNRTNGKKCSYCANSKGEEKIASFLKSKNIVFYSHVGIDGCKDKKKLPFDFYLPEYGLYIEYQGIQHYDPVCFGKPGDKTAQDSFDYVVLHDKIKRDFCFENKINFLEITYLDFDNIYKILDEKISSMTEEE